jgi:ATP-dependent HslUV protease subunit HslV
MENNLQFHATTIVAVKRDGKACDGRGWQVSFNNTILKHLGLARCADENDKIIAGFAGSTGSMPLPYSKNLRESSINTTAI